MTDLIKFMAWTLRRKKKKKKKKVVKGPFQHFLATEEIGGLGAALS